MKACVTVNGSWVLLAAIGLSFAACSKVSTSSLFSAAATPHPATFAKETALRQHPELGVKDSAFNKAFVEIYNARAESAPDKLAAPDWPLDVAREASKIVSTKVTSTPAPSGAWMQTATSALNKEAYNKTSGPGRAINYSTYGTSSTTVIYTSGPRIYYTNPVRTFRVYNPPIQPIQQQRQ